MINIIVIVDVCILDFKIQVIMNQSFCLEISFIVYDHSSTLVPINFVKSTITINLFEGSA